MAASGKESWGPPHYGAFVLRPKGDPEWVDLGPANEIEAQAAAFRRALQTSSPAREAPQIADAQRAGRLLHDVLFALLTAHLDASVRSLLVAPDSELNLVPLAALSYDDDGAAHYLAERYAITYLTSGRDLLRLRKPSPARGKPIVVASPDFGAAPRQADTAEQSADTPQRSRDLSDQPWNALPGTRKEGEAMGKLLAVEPWMGRRASEAALKAVRGPRILHVATHGFFLPDEPRTPPRDARSASGSFLAGETSLERSWENTAALGENPLLRSGLALAGANALSDGSEDGILTALELAGIDLSGTQLVVLSACETGVGEIQNGEGVYGLRRALVLAGAQSQVTTLWKVNDEGTRRFMEAFYRRLARSEPRSEALREVQLEIVKSPEYRHPFYWAGFVPIGARGPVDLTARSGPK